MSAQICSFVYSSPYNSPPPTSRRPRKAQSVNYFPTRSHTNSLFLIVCVTELHPCVSIDCPYYATCKAKSATEHECVCAFSCPTFEDNLCSAQGVTYSNECEYKKAICLSKKHVGISHPGSCKRK